jgi:hypothetical protein
VRIDELLRAVRLVLGEPVECSAADADGDGSVRIDDVIAAVNAALAGCD